MEQSKTDARLDREENRGNETLSGRLANILYNQILVLVQDIFLPNTI
jgi:hypothetical protein